MREGGTETVAAGHGSEVNASAVHGPEVLSL